MADYRFTVPAGLDLLSSNQRLHWAVRARRVKAIRQWASWEAVRQQVPKAERVSVSVWVHPGSRTRRIDPPNYADTVKALIDGVVDAGVLPDDTGKHGIAVTYKEGARWPRTTVEVLFKGL